MVLEAFLIYIATSEFLSTCSDFNFAICTIGVAWVIYKAVEGAIVIYVEFLDRFHGVTDLGLQGSRIPTILRAIMAVLDTLLPIRFYRLYIFVSI